MVAVGALSRRALGEVIRVPGAAIPGVLAPTFFMLGTASVFGALTILPGYGTQEFLSFIVPVSMLQSAGFAGAATGVNLARDIEQGWFDRLLASPVSRPALLAGTVLSASARALMPITLALTVAFALGVDFPGVGPLLLSLLLTVTFAAVAACWTVILALRFRTQSAAPLMQASVFMTVLFSTAYAPKELLSGWLREIATINPVTNVLEAVRQGFVGGVNLDETWRGVVTLLALGVVLALLALGALRNATE